MKISCIVETRAVVAMKILINPLGCSEKEKEKEGERNEKEGEEDRDEDRDRTK